MDKKTARLRRAKKTRMHIHRLGGHRLCIHRTLAHIYAQIMTDDENGQSKVLASASTLDKTIREDLKGTKSEQAKIIGKIVGERALKAGIKKVAFDRSGFKYHGRVKAIAEGAREAGLEF